MLSEGARSDLVSLISSSSADLSKPSQSAAFVELFYKTCFLRELDVSHLSLHWDGCKGLCLPFLLVTSSLASDSEMGALEGQPGVREQGGAAGGGC